MNFNGSMRLSKTNTILYLCIVGVILIFVSVITFKPSDLAGWLLSLCNFGMLFVIPKLHKNKRLFMVIFAAVLIREIFAFTNAYFFILDPRLGDDQFFRLSAIELAKNHPFTWFYMAGEGFYISFLGFFYALLGRSYLLGEELSIFAFILSCIFLLKLFDLLEIKQNHAWLVALYSFIPFQILLSSDTMRESWETLFLMMTVYFGLEYNLKKKWTSMWKAIISAFILCLFHYALLVYSGILIPLVLLYKPYKGGHSKPLKVNFRRLTGWVVVIGGVVLVAVLMYKILGLKTITPLYLFHKEVEYRRSVKGFGRSYYGIQIDSSSPLRLIETTAEAYLYFLFGPFPWDIKVYIEFYYVFEAVVRTILILSSFYAWLNSPKSYRKILNVLLMVYLSINFMWGIAIPSYGTAARHMMISYWIIIATGGPTLFTAIEKKFRLQNAGASIIPAVNTK